MEQKMNKKINELERIAEEADLAALALTSVILGENKGLLVLQQRMNLVSLKAKGLMQMELDELNATG